VLLWAAGRVLIAVGVHGGAGMCMSMSCAGMPSWMLTVAIAVKQHSCMNCHISGCMGDSDCCIPGTRCKNIYTYACLLHGIFAYAASLLLL